MISKCLKVKLYSYLSIIFTQCFTTIIYANPTALVVKGAQAYFDDKKIDEIAETVKKIDANIKTIMNAHLNSAISAYKNAALIKNEDEKRELIVSARNFLLQAINIEKTPERKALSYLMLGHSFLILGQKEPAIEQFKEALAIPFPSKGWISKSMEFIEPLYHVKRDATQALCSLELALKKEGSKPSISQCGLHVAYQQNDVTQLEQLEKCRTTLNQSECIPLINLILNKRKTVEKNKRGFIVGFITENLITPQISQQLGYDQYSFREKNQKTTFQQENLDQLEILSDQFDPCTQLTEGSQIPARINACFSRGLIFLGLGKAKDAVHYLKNSCHAWHALSGAHQCLADSTSLLCKNWAQTYPKQSDLLTDEDIDLLIDHGISESCTTLEMPSVWRELSSQEQAQLSAHACLRGNLNSCVIYAQMVSMPTERSAISVWQSIYNRCALEQSLNLEFKNTDSKEILTYCELIDRMNQGSHFIRLQIDSLKIKGTKPDGSSWDINSGNPDVRMSLTLNENYQLMDHSMEIDSIITDATGKPAMYVLKALANPTLPLVKSLYGKSTQVKIVVIDTDAVSNDTIGEITLDLDQLKTPVNPISFGSVMEMKIKVLH